MVIPAGASLEELIRPYGYSTWQRINRRQGTPSLYNPSVSSANPVQFSMGAFEVPKTMGLFVTQIGFRAFTFSGIAAGDTVEVDPGNLTTSLAFDFRVGANRPFQAEDEIVPVIITADDQLSARASNSAGLYASASASGQAASSGAQRGLLPLDLMRPGSDVGPLSVYIVSQDGKFSVDCYVFEPLDLPVAFFELKISGYITGQSESEKLLQKLRA